MSDADKLQRVAQAICRERSAVYGEPPCHDLGHRTADCECDEACEALARAAIDAMEPQQ